MKSTRKSIKRSLLVSTAALVLSIAMLIGTTFAWFTDSVTSGVNKIQAGNLKIALARQTTDGNWEDAEGKVLEWKAKDNRPQKDILWEPGCTYDLQPIHIVNKGNLAVKYKVTINGITGDTKLLEAITFTATTGEGESKTPLTLAADGSFEGVLLPNGESTTTGKDVGTSKPITITGHMKEEAGNEYKELSIEGISITVDATQYTYEKDSFNDQYDQNAPNVYPAGVTKDSFTDNNTVAYTTADNNTVQYAADFKDAITKGATAIYFKEGASIGYVHTHTSVMNDLTIFANGVDFENSDIGLGYSNANNKEGNVAQNITLKIYNAKNLSVWGYSPASGVTQNVIFQNCSFAGKSQLGAGDANQSHGIFYVSGKTGALNITLNNCNISNSTTGVYTNADGNLTINNCVFTKCSTGVKASHKGSGTLNVTVKGTTFNECGCTSEMAANAPKDNQSWLENDSASIKCKSQESNAKVNLTLDTVAINSIVGDHDIVTVGDDKCKGTTDVTATNVTVDGTPWSNTASTNP